MAMPSHVIPQFITGDFVQKRVFLEDREYGLALDALVKACSDVLVLSFDGNRALLGCRKVEPQPDWWFIGGRATPGDTTRDAAARNVKRELGLDLDVSRFEVIATYSMVWRMRQQPPSTNGTADISTVHTLQLTPEEEGTITMDPREYSDSRYFTLEEILAGDFHPCLQQSVRDLHKRRALDTLVAAATLYEEKQALSKSSILESGEEGRAATPQEVVSSGGKALPEENGTTGVAGGLDESHSSLVAAALAFCRSQSAASTADGQEQFKVTYSEERYKVVDMKDESSDTNSPPPTAALAAAAATDSPQQTAFKAPAPVGSGGAVGGTGGGTVTTALPLKSAAPAGFGGREDTRTATSRKTESTWAEEGGNEGLSKSAEVANAWLSEFPSAPSPGSSVVEAQLDAQLQASGMSASGGGAKAGESSSMLPPTKKPKHQAC
mmetsp:Transcript_645/g.1345  ORF Transcript_645/g.1345 Transcript_645/m.1345 type:complete len:438 (+) Transcript_645:50-1363(+)